jgi:PAS domain S-box-containing protein
MVLKRQVKRPPKACAGSHADLAATPRRVEMKRLSFEAFFTRSIDLMVVASADGFFKRANPAFCQALGYSEAELLAQPFLKFVHPKDVKATRKEVNKLTSGVDTLRFENRYRHKDGSWRLLDWTASAGDDVMYCVARNLTESKAREKQRDVLAHLARNTPNHAYSREDLIRISDFLARV